LYKLINEFLFKFAGEFTIILILYNVNMSYISENINSDGEDEEASSSFIIE